MDLEIRDADCISKEQREEIEETSYVSPGATIHKWAQIGRGVSISRAVQIGRNAWIGNGVVLSYGCTIMPGVLVAHGSVVSRNETITQNTIAILGVQYCVTLTEYGIRIGCEYRTPEEWNATSLDSLIPNGERYSQQLDCVLALWRTSFEWIE